MTEALPGPSESLTPDALMWLGPGAMGYRKASQNERKEGREAYSCLLHTC